SLLVGPDNKVVHLSASVGRYLVHPGGELTASVLKLVRDELRIELRTLLQSVRETGKPADSNPISVGFNGDSSPVVMRVRPVLEAEQEKVGFTLSLNVGA